MNADDLIEPASSPRHEEIAARAYALWLEQGCGHGHDQEHWFQAERELARPERAPRTEEPEIFIPTDVMPDPDQATLPGRPERRSITSL